MNRTLHNQRGQGLIEYLILVALMGVATIGMIRVVNEALNKRFANVAKSIQGQDARVERVQIEDRLHSRKDMGNFMNGAASEE